MPGPGSYFDPAALAQLYQQPYFPEQVAQKGGPGAPLDDLITEYGGGSGARGGASLPARPARPPRPMAEEVMPPERGLGGGAQIDWVKPLREAGFHDLQLKHMTPQQIQEAAMKVQHARLGPMLAPLREMGLGPAEIMRITPQEAMGMLKGRTITQPTGNYGGGWLGELLKKELGE